MKRTVSLALLLTLTATVAGQDEMAKLAAPRTLSAPLTGWEWFCDVQSPDWKTSPRWVDFLVSPAVFDKARQDLGDLRLIDAKEREVPYGLRIRTSRDEQQELVGREFNRATGADGAAELSLDLNEEPREYNEIRVTANGVNYRRRILLDASNDNSTWQSLKLDREYLIDFRVENATVAVNRFHFSASRFRYLRVKVFPDPGLKNDRPEIQAASAWRTISVPGENVTHRATLGERQPERGEYGQPGSAWMIDFGGKVPVKKLSFDIAETEFRRTYALEVPGTEDEDAIIRTNQQIASGTWERRPGEKAKPLEIDLHSEQFIRRLRLVVTDHGNPPLSLTDVRYTAPAREVVFTPTADFAPPLRLYFGNPAASRPQYDYESLLPPALEPAPVRGTLGEPQANPNYIPPPKPLTERWPWLVYVVLGFASAALLGILTTLGRDAIARHDAQASPPSAPEPPPAQ